MKNYGLFIMLISIYAVNSFSNAHAQSLNEWQFHIDEAERASNTGNRVEAISHLEDAIAIGQTNDQKAQALLELGTVYGAQNLSDSARAYCEASDLASGQLRLQAGNNCATQLLVQGNDYDALYLMRRLWSEFRSNDLPAVARSRVLYNYALALERTGTHELAQEYFQQSFEADPGFTPAAQSVSRIALNSASESIGIPEMLGLVRGLVESGKYESAGEQLKLGLGVGHWQGHPQYPQLITQLAVFFAESRTAPAQFESHWEDNLRVISDNLGRSNSAMLSDIENSYYGQFDIDFDPFYVRNRYDAWNEPDGFASLSALFKMLGDILFRDTQNDAAFKYYLHAWTIDTTNVDAAIYAANLLASDDDLRQEYLDPFMTLAFDLKGEAYLGNDWRSILRLHTVLGSLFEELQIWGSEEEPRSAIFQWQRAIIANEKLGIHDPERIRSTANLRENLANSYAGDSQWQKAWREYLSAAEGYVRLGRTDEAKRVLDTAKSTLPNPDQSTAESIELIEGKL